MSRIMQFEGDSLSADASPSIPPQYIRLYLIEGGQATTYGTNFAQPNAIIGTPASVPPENSIWARQPSVAATYVPGELNILTLEIGTNTVKDQTELNNLTLYWDTMRAIGFVMVGITITPVGTTNPPGWTNRDSFWNSSIRAGVPAHIDVCCDFAADPIMGPDNAPSNSVIYGDAAHPTVLGYNYLSRNMRPVLETLISAGSRNLRLR